jgi:hypothetical protein
MAGAAVVAGAGAAIAGVAAAGAAGVPAVWAQAAVIVAAAKAAARRNETEDFMADETGATFPDYPAARNVFCMEGLFTAKTQRPQRRNRLYRRMDTNLRHE